MFFKKDCCCELGHALPEDLEIKNMDFYLKGISTFVSDYWFRSEDHKAETSGICTRCNCVVQQSSSLTSPGDKIVKALMGKIRDLKVEKDIITQSLDNSRKLADTYYSELMILKTKEVSEEARKVKK